MNIILIDEFPAILNEIEVLVKQLFTNSKVYKFQDLKNTIEFFKSHNEIDLIITDISFTDDTILQNIHYLPIQKSKCIIYTGIRVPDILNYLYGLNYSRIVSKSSNVNDLILAMQCCIQNRRFLCNKIDLQIKKSQPRDFLKPMFKEKEIEMLEHAVNGLTVTEIADKMCISEHAIRNYRKNLISRNNCNFYTIIKQYIEWYT